MKEKHCENCHFANPAGYRQVICRKRNRFEPELYSCEWWKEKGDEVLMKELKQPVKKVEPEKIAELISRRRRQILVHSIIYYRFNDNIISDSQWSEWAKELVDLQKNHPDIADMCELSDEFYDFDGSTGYNLPLDNEWGVSTALRLLKDRDNFK